MTELLWQTVLLLAAAFFCGAVLACSLKRRFYYGRSAAAVPAAVAAVTGAPTTPDASQPKIEVAPRAAGDGERFGRALSGQTPAPVQSASPAPARAAAPAPTAAAPTQPAPAPAAPPAAAPAMPAPVPAAPAAAASAPAAPVAAAFAASVAPAAAAPLKPAEPPAPAPQPAPAAAKPETAEGMPRVSVSTGSGAPIKLEEGGAGPSDDLTRIRGIDSIMQGRLKQVGIRRFGDLAALTTSDIKGLSETLGLDARISLENWVGQAQVLAGGGETHYSRRVDAGLPLPEHAEPSAPASPAAPTPAAVTETAPAASASAPAAASPVAEPAPAAAAVAAPVATPAPAAAPSPAPAAADNDTAPSADVAHLRSVRSEALLGEEGARIAANRRGNDVDDLKRIRGIGVLIEKKLNSLGILNYEQVANWTGADIERISRILDFKGRIEREHWIEQARILATGGQTEFSRRGDR